MAGQSTAALGLSTTLSEILGLKDGSTVRQAIGDLALQLIASPEMAAAVGNYDLFQGEWDASSGAFPAGATKGQFWRVSGAGTVDGVAFSLSDVLLALVDDAGTLTYDSNWHRAGHASFAHVHAISDVSGLSEALAALAPVESAALTGTPTAPTAKSPRPPMLRQQSLSWWGGLQGRWTRFTSWQRRWQTMRILPRR